MLMLFLYPDWESYHRMTRVFFFDFGMMVKGNLVCAAAAQSDSRERYILQDNSVYVDERFYVRSLTLDFSILYSLEQEESL